MLSLFLASSLAQPAPAPKAVEPECRVLARGDGYVVHVVPRGPRAPGGLARAGDLLSPRLVQDSGVLDRGRSEPRTVGAVPEVRMVGSGDGGRLAVLHTNLKTGEMKKLAEGGEWTAVGPPMGLTRVTHYTHTLAAVATGPDRLYVLAMRSTTESYTHLKAGAIDRTGAKLQHVLYVFRLTDGDVVQHLVLPETRERLAGFAEDRLDPDLIRVTPTTVTVGTATFRIVERLEPVEPKP